MNLVVYLVLSIDKVDEIRNIIVAACEIVLNTPGIFELVRTSDASCR